MYNEEFEQFKGRVISVDSEQLTLEVVITRGTGDTMRNYARSRTSQNFTDAALGS